MTKKLKNLISLSMKMNYKKIFTIRLALLFVIVILAPVLILAQQKGNSNGNGSNAAKGFCNRVSKISSDTGQRFGNSNAKLEQKRERIRERVEERRQERDQRYEQKREKWDDNRAEHFAKLDEKAGTNEQKRVALEFQEAVNAAIRARRDAVNAAIQQFRQGIEDAKIVRKGSTDEAITAFRASSEAAIENAQADCEEDGVDPKAVQQTLRNDIKAAKQEYISARQETEKIDIDMEALITAKREAIEEAQDVFKQALEDAKADFKADFPEDEEDEGEQEEEED